MADNITAGGYVFATREIAGVHFMQMKINFGPAGAATEVTDDTPLPVSIGDAAADLAAIRANTENPNAVAPIKVGPNTVLDYAQVTGLESVKGLGAIPPGAKTVWLQAEGKNIRFRPGGDDPTPGIGMILYAGAAPLIYSGNLAAIEFIEVEAGAKLNALFWA